MHVKILDERVVSRAKARGIDVLVYAPHFVRLPDIRARAERFSDDELLVVPAREVFTGGWNDRKHLLALGLSDPVPDFITLDGALDEFERQGAAVLVPHPELLTVSLTVDDVVEHREALHAVETYNAKAFARHNRRGREIAREADMPGFGSSYAHLRGTIGEAWTEFDRDIDSEAALVEALREGAGRRVKRRSGLSHTLRGTVEFAHLGYENSWGKIDRLLLSGMEPTHPNHIAYDGQFDDVSVY
ncbi:MULTISPECIES: PHP-associated domain-containing protein [Haloferax]|uniref:PHP domain-containing protein n=1 Tax=Haloferax marinum TaxID=2666143 RepID=A0A6A8G507_9EURY|nr:MULTISPECIES: PHP-associated domain-containing protein [Haloferax]KAB1197053.1 PHP domain-containing protein [Haloferax sp. CBA1150]MRW96079.1 PHP domain-containing protein [Haloferax marinum]